MTAGAPMWWFRAPLPVLEGLLAHPVVLRLSVLVEVGAQPLGVPLVGRCQTQLQHALVETH